MTAIFFSLNGSSTRSDEFSFTKVQDIVTNRMVTICNMSASNNQKKENKLRAGVMAVSYLLTFFRLNPIDES